MKKLVPVSIIAGILAISMIAGCSSSKSSGARAREQFDTPAETSAAGVDSYHSNSVAAGADSYVEDEAWEYVLPTRSAKASNCRYRNAADTGGIFS